MFLGGFLLAGVVAGYLVGGIFPARKLKNAERQASKIIEAARKEAELKKNELADLERSIKAREEDVARERKALLKKEEALIQDLKDLDSRREKIKELEKKAMDNLEKVAGLTIEEAKNRLFDSLKEHYREELAKTLQKLEKERREEIEKKSTEIMLGAMQRYARSSVTDATTSVFHLPNEDIKGKIIGKEGRNIRSFERETGTELLIDESPGVIVISSFDPLRREIARVALSKLIQDGRIHPAKIEEKVEEARQELDKRMIQIGEEAALELGIMDLPKEILQLLGRLHFRTSYGQNVLQHSLEMAHIGAMIAAELGLDVDVVKRGALLHDIGKAISHEVEGTHVELGRKILKKYGIDDKVIKAMESHHEEYPFSTPESFLVAAVDALSAARPGARRDTVENYIKRISELEELAKSFPGVKNAFALSAGREIRVFVTPEKVDDFGAFELAKNIASKIQTQLKYPGEIKVNVIRETRAVEYAR